MPDHLQGYELKDIYNLDETGLFYRSLPDRSLGMKGKDCVGGKKSKDRLTACLIVNALGDVITPTVIGEELYITLHNSCRKHFWGF